MSANNKRSMSNESKSDSTPARAYPRKRVSIACEVCRLRKTRCDAAKPACSFCSELGIECVYKRPADATRPDPRSEEFTQALQRLDKIELTLDTIARAVLPPERRPSYYPGPEASPFIGTPLAFRHEPVTPSPASVSTGASKPNKRRYGCKMPTLLSFRHPTPEHTDWSWNCTEFFFNDQIEAAADMRQNVNLPHPDPDLADPHLGHLQRAFSDHVLKWLPLLDPTTAAQHLRYARSTEYRHTNSSLCIVFLIFANGAIAADAGLYTRAAHEVPGFAYFARALAILDRLPSPSKDLTAVQCRVLATIYLLFAMRPLEAWKHISLASQECILLLRANTNQGASTEYREAFRRIYWICYVLENELEACLEVPPSGIRMYATQVPWPSSHSDEEGMYFLLALSSLRKVMVEVLDTVGYKSSTGYYTYNPAVALELQTQIDEWYRHLPGPLRFQMDSSMLFDTRRAYLRCSYFALRAVATWPFVMPLSQAPFGGPANADTATPYPHPSPGPTSHPSQEAVPTLSTVATPSNGAGTPTAGSSYLPERDSDPYVEASHRQAATSCLEACRSYLTYAEEILTSKSLVSHLVVRQYYAFTMILILSFDGVNLQDGGSMEQRRHLEGAVRNLGYWSCVPFLGDSLSNMVRIGRARGLRVG